MVQHQKTQMFNMNITITQVRQFVFKHVNIHSIIKIKKIITYVSQAVWQIVIIQQIINIELIILLTYVLNNVKITQLNIKYHHKHIVLK